MERAPIRPIRQTPRSESSTPERLEDPLMQAAVEIAACRGDDERAALRKQLHGQFTDGFEAIEALFDAWEVISKQQAFDAQRNHLTREQLRKWLLMFTEDQFLLTHFMLVNGSNRGMLESFWRGLEYIADRHQVVPELASMRSGVVSQVAVYRILEQLDELPLLSHPQEDAYDAIDVWAAGDVAVQVKGWNQSEPELIESDVMALPAVTVASGTSAPDRVYTPHDRLIEKSHVFYTNVEKYARRTGRPVKGYVMVVPFSKMDSITGEPSEDVVAFFREKMQPH